MKTAVVKRVLALGACVGMVQLSAPCQGLEGLIVDGSTGKPLAGVYVIGAWWTSKPMAVVSKSGCGKIEVSQSDERGRFALSKWSGSILAHFFGTENLNVYYYARGYRWDKGLEMVGETIVLVPDTRPPLERLGHLSELIAKSDCGSRRDRIKYALPIYRLMYSEGEAIASQSNRQERIALSNLLFSMEVLEFGYQQALKRDDSRGGYP
jgi:hypothetical protein